MSEYPEHEKLARIHDQSQVIGQFVEEFLPTKSLMIAWEDGHSRTPSIDDLLAEFFGIDRSRIEAEKRAILDRLREEHG